MVSEGKKPKDLIVSATELQSNIDGLRVLLAEKKVSWQRMFAAASAISEEAVKEQWSLLQSGKASKDEINLGGQQQSFWFLLETIARLAIDITDARERLAKVEKGIGNLRRAMK